MTWFFAVLVVVTIGAVAVVASGRGGSLGPAYDDRPDVLLPEGPVTGEDLRALRLNTAVRGYRCDEVDALIERLAAQLDADPLDAAEDPRAAPLPDSGPSGPPDAAH